MRIERSGFAVSAFGLVVLACAPSAPQTRQLSDSQFDFLASRSVYQPQILSPDGENVVLVWREDREAGSDLYASRSTAGRAFAEPVRINDIPGSVAGINLDETRPAVAFGPDERIGVAWNSRQGDIYASVGSGYGERFARAAKLNRNEGKSYRGFPAIAFDSEGDLHAIWIDGRFAPAGAEEPAELFYARLSEGEVEESNLTVNQEASVCGCCRPDLKIGADGRRYATFRNTTEDGYRDIFQIEIEADGTARDPERFGPALWKLAGCPVAGPVNLGDRALWMERSTGKWRLLSATPGQEEFITVLQDEDEWTMLRPPRVLNPSHSDADYFLIPGHPQGRVLQRNGNRFEVVRDDIPAWAMGGVLHADQLIVVGSEKGRFQLETRHLGG